jgi:hypothetical protein
MKVGTGRPTIEGLLDRQEILDLFNRYTFQHDVLAPRFATGDQDGSEFDIFDQIFTPDAVLDYTSSGGIRADVETMKKWLPAAYENFPVQHHVMGQTELSFTGSTGERTEATARTWVINPMGFRKSDGSVRVFTAGGVLP